MEAFARALLGREPSIHWVAYSLGVVLEVGHLDLGHRPLGVDLPLGDRLYLGVDLEVEAFASVDLEGAFPVCVASSFSRKSIIF